MAEKDADEPSLELPSFFGRRKKKDQEPPARGGASGSSSTAEETGSAASNAPAAATRPAVSSAPRAATGPASGSLAATTATTSTATASTATASTATPDTATADTATATATGPVEPDEPAAGAPSRSTRAPGARRKKERSTPSLAASTAAVVVGAVVGVLGLALTYLGLLGCELVTGTDSCGGPGLLVLLAIVFALILIGAALLRVFAVPEAGSLSFLGVGLMVVLVLVFLMDRLEGASILVILPLLTAGCFAVARWITVQLAEDVMSDPGPPR